jgi:hypothetical protein
LPSEPRTTPGWRDTSRPPACASASPVWSQATFTDTSFPSIGALNFVLHGMVDGGVTRTLALDTHGKSLSSALLDMEIPDDDG